jgi:hypothetical protein
MGKLLNSKTGTKHQIIGWSLLIAAGTLRLRFGNGSDLVWNWTDYSAFFLTAVAVALIIIGHTKRRREEDRKRARFL